MIQNIGGFLTLAWLWSQRDKTLDEAPVENGEVPVEEEVTVMGTLDPCASMTPGSPAWISCVATYGEPPTNGNGNGNGNGCPPTESRLDLTTADTINYDPTAYPPCGCPPGYRKVEVKRGKYQTATRCYNGV